MVNKVCGNLTAQSNVKTTTQLLKEGCFQNNFKVSPPLPNLGRLVFASDLKRKVGKKLKDSVLPVQIEATESVATIAVVKLQERRKNTAPIAITVKTMVLQLFD